MTVSYIGTRTTALRNARGKGLSVWNINDDTGEWTQLQVLKEQENPSYLTFDNQQQFLYSVHGDYTDVTSYAIDETTGTLTFINKISLEGGKNPVFITVDKSNRFLLVATLQGGKIFVIRREENGALGEVVFTWRFAGKTDDAISHAHQCIWDQDKNYLFVPQQGRVVGYAGVSVLKFDPESGRLIETDYFRAREYAEPRHMAVHPNNEYCYLVNEKDNTVTWFFFDQHNGTLQPQQIIPVLPETYTGEGQSSAILVDNSGKWVIESTRIHESLSIFRINPLTGYLTRIETMKVPGKTPRFMTFNSTGDRLYVANEDSDTIIQYAFDSTDGSLTQLQPVITTESPVCILFKSL
ncbi:lactonase family protein [Escherichia fergusonii]|uniref:lactonase family protein n=1 Tax=Escherichia fergusonii TaxID=564 RepID=UPI000CF33E23|nr:lactonase family protein [Escherichia fergusonii]EFF0770919.1 lactonase family protein [Escherichia fergusonii]EHJ4131174.1 lactonase family protein [Escherichia fergusonii]EHJ4140019.1 lactonase family protein [Escherichia fergusonii]MBA8226303.1 lactonase family protein [Escherichia fergusonii]MBA8499450.1 lactonase family protein [Escherichia fergusonii]